MSCAVFFGSLGAVNAAGLEVTFTAPDKYIDIRPGDENQHHYNETVFYNIRKQLTKLAEDLPDDQLLKVDIVNIDLAGDIRMTGNGLIRVISQMYSPYFKFTYQLEDKDKKVIVQGEEAIRDKSFMTGTSLRYRNEYLGYEKQLFDDWFEETFVDTNMVKKEQD